MQKKKEYDDNVMAKIVLKYISNDKSYPFQY